jgi:uncharacterized protein (TIGR02466 family)
MPSIDTLFATQVYRATLAGRGAKQLVGDLDTACRSIAVDDRAGQAWCKANGYKGYTSYASLDDLAWRDPSFAELTGRLDDHVAAFARALDFELGGGKLVCDSLWINVLKPGGQHGGHIHPLSVISGTIYIAVPPGASALRLEDPRHALMMAAPPKKAKARPPNRPFVDLVPRPGTLILWESFVRHAVPESHAKTDRISISFNYRWARARDRDASRADEPV